MAYCVVGNHACLFYENGEVRQYFLYCLSYLAVPFFFLCSGYFLGVKLYATKNIREYRQTLRKYFKRLLIPFFVWGILNIITTWCVNFIHDIPLTESIPTTLHAFLVSTPGGGLWYVETLLWMCVILMFSNKWLFHKCLFVFCALMFVVYPMMIIYSGHNATISIISEWYHKVFLSERNFVFQGLYFMLGLMISRLGIINCKNLIKTKYLICILFVCVVLLICNCYDTPLLFELYESLLIVVAVLSIFFIGFSCVPSWFDNKRSIKCRISSSVIYFTHILTKEGIQFAFLLCGLTISYNLLFLAVCFVTTIFAVLVNKYRMQYGWLRKIF